MVNRTIISGVMMLLLISCGNIQESSVNEKTVLEFHAPAQKQPVKSAKTDEGKNIFTNFCLSCHQKDASGVPGMYPPLQNNKVVTGDKKKIINIVINGLQGEIEVDGEVYNQTMPPQNYLTNAQIAKVLSYLRQNFGNKADSVKVSDVNNIRKSK
jgi:mono/diheme cytochrome c family protein